MRPPSLYTPRLLLILSLQFIFGLGFSSFLLLPKYLTETHGADATSIGRIVAAGPLAAVCMVPLQAAWIDRFRRHRLMLACAVMLSSAAFGFTLLDDLGGVVYLLRLMQGAAFASFMATATTLVAEITPPERLGQAIGLSGAANLVTNAIGPGLAEPIAASWGWRVVFLLSALVAALAGLGTFALGDARVVVGGARRGAWVGEPRRLALLHAGLVAGLGFGVVITFYQPFALSLGIGEVRALFIGYTVAALGVRVVCGAWLDRIERRLLALCAASVYPLVVFATAWLSPGWLFPLGAALGLAQGTLYPVVSALLFEQSEPDARGALMTYFSGCFNFGFVLATIGLGALASQIGYRALFVVASLLTLTAVPVLATTLGKARGTA